MKKTIKYAVLVIALFLAGFCGYMERKYSAIRMVKSEIIPEKILEEFPEIAITEGDLALETYILGLPEVQTMIEQSKKDNTTVQVSNAEAAELLYGWVEDGWTVLELACMDNTVYLSWIKDGDRNVYYAFAADGRYPIQKTIGIFQRHFDGTTSVETIYSNLNGIIEKNISKRQWFHWITVLMENE